MAGVSKAPSLYSLTIFGYRKKGMSDADYHDYISQKHAPVLKQLLLKNDIVDYTIQHNSTTGRLLLGKIFTGSKKPPEADFDAVIQISFKEVADYINVMKDKEFRNLVAPDHEKFADLERTKMMTGWFERHI